ncbi:uncharacterized protein LOC142491563 [Ascaphus truei]|uniref:uncharacterized protein LOC142491563 n=1 Tax=Ascaphus truei TaxID=8439 RepID=UPI003F5A5ADE
MHKEHLRFSAHDHEPTDQQDQQWQQQEQVNPNRCKLKSRFIAPFKNSSVSVFMNLIKHDVKQHFKKHHYTNYNLTIAQKEALKTLRENSNIIFKKADKGGALVVQDYSVYKTEVLRQLENQECYIKLDMDPTVRYQTEIRGILQLGLNNLWISEEIVNFLTMKNPRRPVIYLLPKIHKSLQNPPGRPIISATCSINQPLAVFIDTFLQPLVIKNKSYIRDTFDFLTKIRTVPLTGKNLIMVTMDVTNLYTIIPHDGGLDVIRRNLTSSHKSNPPVDFIMLLLHFVLYKNYFKFEQTFYLQTAGTAMGSNVAPSYANLYMTDFEEQFIYPTEHYKRMLFYCRYIDDLLFLWEGTEEELIHFFDYLDGLNTTVRFTKNWSTK